MALARSKYRELLLRYLIPYKFQVGLLTVLLFSNIGLQLFQPYVVSSFIDNVMAKSPLQQLFWLAGLFLGIAVIAQLVSVSEAYVAENLGMTVTNTLRSDLLEHCLWLDPTFHHAHTPGELVQRIDGDVSALGNFFSRFVIQLLGNCLLLLGILVLSFRIDWRVGLTLTVFSLLAVLVMDRMRNRGVAHWIADSEAKANLSSFIEERLSGVEDIRSNGATGYVLYRLAERSFASLIKGRRATMAGLWSYTSFFIITIGTVIALGLSGYLLLNNSIQLGSVYVIYAFTELIRRPISELSRQFRDLQQASGSILRTQELLGIQNAIVDGQRAMVKAEAPTISFQHVTFGYGEAAPVLRDLSFDVRSGSVLGLLGRTGSGKTTITRLLYRLYDPQSGSICLNGVDLRDFSVATLRKHIGVVTQDIQLFHGTIRDNLTFFSEDMQDERIIEIIHDLGLERWYNTLPNGLSSQLAPDSTGLSAGEAQLLAFARVFLQDPEIVILDEASSRLDPATEQSLERATTRLLEGRTAIIIAHRLQTIQRADTVLILENGECREYGERKQLAEKADSRFYQLLQVGLEELV